jgi:hypothetical protein
VFWLHENLALNGKQTWHLEGLFWPLVNNYSQKESKVPGMWGSFPTEIILIL